jgi:hypothetical protein
MSARMLFAMGLTAIAITTAASCATGGGGTASSRRNRITGEEMAESNASTVYQALSLLRPSWLSGRGPVSMTDPTEARPNVYMNGNRVGDLDYLRNINVIDVREIRFWEPGEAGARFGMGNPRGVIEVVPRM